MRNTVDEINAMNSNLGQRIATIKEKLAKEELEKMVRFPIMALCFNSLISFICTT